MNRIGQTWLVVSMGLTRPPWRLEEPALIVGRDKDCWHVRLLTTEREEWWEEQLFLDCEHGFGSPVLERLT